MSQVNTEFEGDPEYEQFEEYVDQRGCAKATAKSYRTSYRKLRNIIGKNIKECAQDTLIKAVMAAVENVNSQQALLNIAIICREKIFLMPFDELVDQRTMNKETVQESLKMNNLFKVLPTLDEFDNFIESLWQKSKHKEYIINFLIRHCNVRNQDLIFDIVDKKADTNKLNTNYIWYDRKNMRCVYIRNCYKTAGTYGKKEISIDSERFIQSIKKVKNFDVFPISSTDDPNKIGYYIQKFSFNQLGESNLLKIIINHYKDQITKLKEISMNRGTDLNTLLTSYNINYTDSIPEHVTDDPNKRVHKI